MSHFKNVLHRAFYSRSRRAGDQLCRCCESSIENLQHIATCSIAGRVFDDFALLADVSTGKVPSAAHASLSRPTPTKLPGRGTAKRSLHVLSLSWSGLRAGLARRRLRPINASPSSRCPCRRSSSSSAGLTAPCAPMCGSVVTDEESKVLPSSFDLPLLAGLGQLLDSSRSRGHAMPNFRARRGSALAASLGGVCGSGHDKGLAVPLYARSALHRDLPRDEQPPGGHQPPGGCFFGPLPSPLGGSGTAKRSHNRRAEVFWEKQVWDRRRALARRACGRFRPTPHTRPNEEIFSVEKMNS